MHTISEAFYRVMVYAYRMGVSIQWPVHDRRPLGPSIRIHMGDANSSYIVEHKGYAWTPSRLVLHWCLRQNTNGDWDACHLVHEISHLLDGGCPEDANELDGPIMALDYYVIRHLRIPCAVAWMDQYELGDMSEYSWRTAPPAVRRDVLQRSLKAAVERDLLDTNGRIQYVYRSVEDRDRFECSASTRTRS